MLEHTKADIILSIIVPVYNTEKYLSECLNSIVAELDDSIEVLVIDDGSKDKSYEIAQKFSDDRVRVLHQSNKGVSYTRNIGIQESTGQYIMFVDSDDKLIKGWSKTIKRAINKGADIVYISPNLKDKTPKCKQLLDSITNIDSSLGMLSGPCSRIFRRNMIWENQITFNLRIIVGEGLLFNLQALFAAQTYDFMSDSIYLYRIHPESATHKFNGKFFESNLLFLRKLKEILEGAHQLSLQESERYIAFSFWNSISPWCHTVLESNLSLCKKKKYLQKLFDPRMQKYAEKYRDFNYPFPLNTRVFIQFYKLHMVNLLILIWYIYHWIKPEKHHDIEMEWRTI